MNKLGDFSYSNFKIADKTISIKNIEYQQGSSQLEYYSKQNLKKISKLILENKDSILYIVSYDLNNIKRAELRVKNIKKFMLSEFNDIGFNDIRIAWFKSPRKIRVDNKISKKDVYVNFFTTKSYRLRAKFNC